ncbi:MAG: coproporphyrinogen III oxidase [Flavobacteriales bacterium]|nr:coproporphyrinogen III oxidase [Flavobacteriales bacterium]
MAGIYIHIPFCAQACHYCDFHFSTSLKLKKRVISAMKKEIIQQKKYLDNSMIKTIYFGGGTPSLIQSAEIQDIYNTIQHNFILSDDVEFTIEANPEDITESLVASWHQIGINRVSLGVQAFKDKDLRYMNRIHTSRQSFRALELLKKSKIKNLSVDLIYGFPNLSDSTWEESLDIILKFDPQHISCYSMTVEKKTPLFHLIKKGVYSKLNFDQANRQFLIARKKLRNSGYAHYEISNFAKDGHFSLHNTGYWNKTHYLGIGPSAHSFNGQTRQWNINNNLKYSHAIENNLQHYDVEKLSRKNMINEYILTRLRTSSGIKQDVVSCKMTRQEYQKFNKEIEKFIDLGLIQKNHNSLSCTESGMLIADSISSDLFLI